MRTAHTLQHLLEASACSRNFAAKVEEASLSLSREGPLFIYKRTAQTHVRIYMCWGVSRIADFCLVSCAWYLVRIRRPCRIRMDGVNGFV